MIKDGVLGRISIRIQLLARIDSKQTFVLGVCLLVKHFVSLLRPAQLCSIRTSLGTGSSGAVLVSHMPSEYVSRCTRVGNEQKRLAALYVKTTYNQNIRTGPEW